MMFHSFIGTLRPDLIESASSLASNKAEAIKTHHNDTDFVRALRAQVRNTTVNIFAVFFYLFCWLRHLRFNAGSVHLLLEIIIRTKSKVESVWDFQTLLNDFS